MTRILCFLALACFLVSVSQAEPALGGSVDYSVVSRYLAHGFNIGDTDCHQPSMKLTSDRLPGANFTLWSSFPTDRDEDELDEIDLMAIYHRRLNDESPWTVAMSAYYDYWFYPNKDGGGGKDFQGHKLHLGASLPRLIPVKAGCHWVPGYNVYYWTPATGDQFSSGGVHELMMHATVPLFPGDRSGIPDAIQFKTTLNYHTGAFGVEEGWSHATAHLMTGAGITESLTWHASVDYQWTFEESLNGGDGDDVLWGTAGLTCSF